MKLYILAIILIILIIIVILNTSNFGGSNFTENNNNSAKIKDVFRINESINFLLKLASKNHINIEAISYENNEGFYIVDREILFIRLLEDNNIFFEILEGITIKLEEKVGFLEDFLDGMEPDIVFFTEIGEIVII